MDSLAFVLFLLRVRAAWLGPDLIGRSISSISLIVTSYRTGVVLNSNTFDIVDYTVTAYGVPEPSSSTIEFCGTAPLAWRRRRRSRRFATPSGTDRR